MPLSHPLRLRATQHPDRGTEWPLGLPIPLLRHLQDRSLTAVARLSPGEDVSFVRTEPVSRRPAQLVSTAGLLFLQITGWASSPRMAVSRSLRALGGGCLGSLIPLLFLVSTASLNTAKIPVAPDCGKPQQLSRIVGGEDSMDAKWPWVVSIQKNGTHHCAGSLLTSRWVVTAAHCFKGDLDQLDLFSVLLGAWQLQNPGPRSQQVGIAWVLPHPGYSWKEAARADIALVRLKHTIQFSERVLPICLPDFSVQLPPNTSCWIAGWGSISDGDSAEAEGAHH
ncbi:brain-specific serine protease 4 isoform X7 [Fukomys damarensis]|uniref:brain-specific serine protease 4 isoform X7 n=1 Tax=Fukomys damarensis TaxID=885580 RepID=UPI0008FF76F7|nr:brain-specific serine protease 4 isoform X7 [Fukomys damarensis]